MEAELRASGGIYTGAAVKLGCAPNTIKNYVERSEDLQEALRQIVDLTRHLPDLGVVGRQGQSGDVDGYQRRSRIAGTGRFSDGE